MNLIARYHEIALKGRNRPFFVEKLADNLRRSLSDVPGVSVHPFSSRIAVQIPDETPWETVRERVERVFGVANFSRAREVAADLEALKRAAAEDLRGTSFASFRVTSDWGTGLTGEVTVKNMAVGRAKSAKLGDRNAWLAERPGQTTIPRGQLIDGIRRLLAELERTSS